MHVKIEGSSGVNNFYLGSIHKVVSQKIFSNIAYQLLKILSQLIHSMHFPTKLSKRTGRQWVLGKKLFLFVLPWLIFWQWLFFFTTILLTWTLSLMRHNENSYWHSMTERPSQKTAHRITWYPCFYAYLIGKKKVLNECKERFLIGVPFHWVTNEIFTMLYKWRSQVKYHCSGEKK